ncbi:hypothetical protein F4680DRAFT_405783 [Xylaria scruposa]|nr:hypothetical protein F4680DRAFT_405783 [Xylaria scruposa]
MASKLQPQTRPSHISIPSAPNNLNVDSIREWLGAEPQVSFPPTSTRGSNNKRKLEQKYNAKKKKVVDDEDLKFFPPSVSGNCSPSSPQPYPLCSLSPLEPPSQDNDKHTTLLSPNTTNPPEPPSIPSQASIASMNHPYPYVLDPEDLARRLSVISPESSDRQQLYREPRSPTIHHNIAQANNANLPRCELSRMFAMATGAITGSGQYEYSSSWGKTCPCQVLSKPAYR